MGESCKAYPVIGTVTLKNGNRWVCFRIWQNYRGHYGDYRDVVVVAKKDGKKVLADIEAAAKAGNHIWLLDGESSEGQTMYFDYSTAKHKPRSRLSAEDIAERAMGFV